MVLSIRAMAFAELTDRRQARNKRDIKCCREHLVLRRVEFFETLPHDLDAALCVTPADGDLSCEAAPDNGVRC